MKISIITATRYRAKKLAQTAMRSLLAQTNKNFEWILINDGGCIETEALVATTFFPFKITYQEMQHPSSGFGLCHARNLGLELAKGDIIAYLDDDNSIHPNYIESIANSFKNNPNLKYCLPLQNRRRDIINDNVVIKGKPFISPICKTLSALIDQRELFDSNGFAHLKYNAPRWNPNYKIFCDYEYLLQCIDNWSADCFQILSQVLINYIQTNEGIIGKSKYTEWIAELKNILNTADRYFVLNTQAQQSLAQLINRYKKLSLKNNSVAAFVN